jgi:hypothetical protein
MNRPDYKEILQAAREAKADAEALERVAESGARMRNEIVHLVVRLQRHVDRATRAVCGVPFDRNK